MGFRTGVRFSSGPLENGIVCCKSDIQCHYFMVGCRYEFVKGQMCSPGIATQVEDLVAGGVKEFVHIGLAGGLNDKLEIGDVVVTEGAFNDTAVAR